MAAKQAMRQIRIYISACTNLGNLSLIGLFFFLLYFGLWDSISKPMLIQLKHKNDALTAQLESKNKKEALYQQFSRLQKDLNDLETRMLPIQPGDSGKLVAVNEASELVRLAKGEQREPAIPALLPPHDKCENVTLVAGEETKFDVREALGGDLSGKTEGISALPAEQHKFTLKMSGTYPALVDFINQLLAHEYALRINRITITKNVKDVNEPDPASFPDYPVKLDMELNLSVFLYEAPANPQQ